MKKAEKKTEIKADLNEIVITGTVQKVITSTEKVERFDLKCQRVSPNGKGFYSFVPVVSYENHGVEEGDRLKVTGVLQSGSYQNKQGKTCYTLDIIADEVELYEED